MKEEKRGKEKKNLRIAISFHSLLSVRKYSHSLYLVREVNAFVIRTVLGGARNTVRFKPLQSVDSIGNTGYYVTRQAADARKRLTHLPRRRRP